MTFLLDANVLIALLDPQHVHHDVAHEWFAAEGNVSWATCPLTENAVIRILSQPSYPNATTSPAVAIDLLREFCSLEGHEFWFDSVSLLDRSTVDAESLLSHGRVTDTYLLALAVSRGGTLTTFDRRLATNAVPKGQQSTKFLVS
jgi:toxin-antitoxin system PIN domain toxin